MPPIRRARPRHASLAAAVAGVMLLLSGCGVPLQSTAQPIPPDVLPSAVPVPPSAEPSASVTPPAPDEEDEPRLRLWFVQNEGLTAVESSLPLDTSPEFVMQALVVGPTGEQTADGLRTIAADPLSGQPLAYLVPSDPSSMALPADDSLITLQLSPDFTALPPSEQVLLLGQLVLSLTGAGASAVAFVDSAGATLAVPLPDGRVLDTPARAGDYGPLIYRP
jgi:hypothetical protein